MARAPRSPPRWLLATVGRPRRRCASRAGRGRRAEAGSRPVLDQAGRADRDRRRARAAADPRRAACGRELDYYSEYIDRARFPEPVSVRASVTSCVLKYKGLALRRRHRDAGPRARIRRRAPGRAVSGTPVVFFASSRAAIRRLPNSTGCCATELRRHARAGGAAAARSSKRLRRHRGGARRQDVRERGRAQFRPFESRFAIDVPDRPSDRGSRSAASRRCRPHSIVYYLLVDRDGAGAELPSAGIPGSSRRPLRTRRSIPGSIRRWITASSAAASRTRRPRSRRSACWPCACFAARRPTAFRSSSPNLNVNQVDWRQLRRWGISEARVPAGTIVKFTEPSAWDRYKLYILGALGHPPGADAAHRGAARSAVRAPAGRGASAWQRGRAAHRATSASATSAARLLNAQETRALPDRTRAARRHQPADGAARRSISSC